MFTATVNFIFASIFASLAWWSLPRGWNFTKIGWRAIQDSTEEKAGNAGLGFFLAGLGWLVAGIFSTIIALILAIVTIIQFANAV